MNPLERLSPKAIYDDRTGDVRYLYRPRTVEQWQALGAYIQRRITRAEGHWMASDALERASVARDEVRFYDWHRLLANVRTEMERRTI
jgi:hypothetical protein